MKTIYIARAFAWFAVATVAEPWDTLIEENTRPEIVARKKEKKRG